jgi:hypothetical protein
MPDALDETRRFVKRYWGDAPGVDGVVDDLRYMARLHRRGIQEGIDAIEALLAAPPEPGVLVHLVAWDGNYPLDSGTDEEATAFLREFAEMARRVLTEPQA